MSKSGLKLVLCRKAKNAERKGIERNFFRHPLKISLQPLEEILKPHLTTRQLLGIAL